MARTQTLDKVIDDITKTKKQINEWQSRLRQLEQQKTELENAEIVGIVRGGNISADELNEIIKMFREDKAVTIEKRQEVSTSES